MSNKIDCWTILLLSSQLWPSWARRRREAAQYPLALVPSRQCYCGFQPCSLGVECIEKRRRSRSIYRIWWEDLTFIFSSPNVYNFYYLTNGWSLSSLRARWNANNASSGCSSVSKIWPSNIYKIVTFYWDPGSWHEISLPPTRTSTFLSLIRSPSSAICCSRCLKAWDSWAGRSSFSIFNSIWSPKFNCICSPMWATCRSLWASFWS